MGSSLATALGVHMLHIYEPGRTRPGPHTRRRAPPGDDGPSCNTAVPRPGPSQRRWPVLGLSAHAGWLMFFLGGHRQLRGVGGGGCRGHAGPEPASAASPGRSLKCLLLLQSKLCPLFPESGCSPAGTWLRRWTLRGHSTKMVLRSSDLVSCSRRQLKKALIDRHAGFAFKH